jgi:hypothetical protein
VTALELLALLLSPFTVLGIHAHRARLTRWMKAAYHKAEQFTRPVPK